MVGKNEKEKLKDYVNFLLGKGYSKAQIKNKLIKKGFNRFLVREVIYPNLKVLVVGGILLIFMILVIAGVSTYALFFKGSDIENPDSEDLLLVKGLSVQEVTFDESTRVVTVFLKNEAEDGFPGGINIKIFCKGTNERFVYYNI